MKRYRLIKDLPTFKAGETFALLDSFETHGLYRESDGVMAYHQTTLYKFPNILMEWFEEIKPVEPLIKDEKIRKAVRAWAEASDVGVVKVAPFGVFDIESSARIYFYSRVIEDKDYHADKSYTIAELCGGEEE